MMTKFHQSLAGTILGASILVLSGCGGGDSTIAVSNTSTAYLVDSNVSGVGYSCGNQSGTTGTDGSFKYQHGQECTFNIGATSFTVAADKLSAGKAITPFDIFAGDDEKAVNLARFLQTLDTDGIPDNGIDISPAARAQIQHQIEFGTNFDANISAEVAGSAYQNQIKTRVKALEHLAQNVAAPATYTTFERIAEIDASAIQTASGFTNPTDQARYVAQKIAKYFYQNNDTNITSAADWVLGGSPASLTALNANTDINLMNPYILEIPSPDNNKTMIVEVCNKAHAGGAIAGNLIPNGEIHGAALPCEIAIYTDTATGKIYIDILDPVGSFAVFFNDLGANPQLTAMALQVKTEIKLIAYKGLDAGSVVHVKKSTGMGATFTPTEIAALSGQYLTYTYNINTNDSTWLAATTAPAKRAVAQKAAQEMIKAMTVNLPYSYTSTTYPTLLSTSTFGSLTFPPYVIAPATGINGNTAINSLLVGDYNISATGYWRSARYAPLSVPRAVDTTTYGFMYTVEACSPTYAKMALSMGGDSRDHATALPCQMSFYIDDSNPLAPKLKVVFLNPVFMFVTLFKDKMSGLTTQQQADLNAMAITVKNDLVNMTRFVMDHNVSWVVPNPTITAD